MTITEPSPPIIDEASLLERIDGDRDLLRELAALFLEDCPRRIAEMRAAIEQQDAKRLELAAHSMKGSTGNLSAIAAAAAAALLEIEARAGDWAHARHSLRLLEEEIHRLAPLLQRLH
jgi:two-component system sensor histidine kinase/response regulator